MPLDAVWPRPLQPGGTIGICSPAGVSPQESIDLAVRALEMRGYRVRVSPNAAAQDAALSYLGGTDAERLSDLNRFLRDPEIDLILCARGGYGSGKLLDSLDYDAIRADPKPLVGYSDITALSLAISAKANVVSFSGLMATAGHGFGNDSLDPWSEANFWLAVRDRPFPRVMGRPEDAPPWNILRDGGIPVVSGPVVPVCLSLLNSLMGTPYVPDLTGAILVLEDVSEELYAIDRFLTQLRLAGVLENLAALLLGSFNGLSPEEDETLRVMVPRLAADLLPPHIALASEIDYGHIRRRLTLPMGATAAVNLAEGTFTFTGPSRTAPRGFDTVDNPVPR